MQPQFILKSTTHIWKKQDWPLGKSFTMELIGRSFSLRAPDSSVDSYITCIKIFTYRVMLSTGSQQFGSSNSMSVILKEAR